ncbi:MAG: potassium-transporting ATPase subunit C [Gemmataceae bacterium]
MQAHVRANLVLLTLTLLIGAGLYPFAVLVVGQGLFPASASGSLVVGPDGQTVGSRLIAQECKDDRWFHPRPSAADYNAASSSGSNLSAGNPKLRERAEGILKSRQGPESIPADAVTASGSGLDPHISLRNARGQLDRVVAAWRSKVRKDEDVRATVEAILAGAAFWPLSGAGGGEEMVNVLEVNLALSRQLSVNEPRRSAR